MDEINDLLTCADVAKRLKVSQQYVRKLITEGKLIGTRVGKQWIVSPNDLMSYIKDYQVIIEPDDHERRTDDVPKIVALSFFSGAMGLDKGMSNGGIHALLACEFDKCCRMTIEKNEPNMALIGDIRKYDPETILKLAKIPKGRKVDIIFGGPPCQAFSTAGARRAFDDERGNVFLRYIEIVKAIQPKYFVIENVRGLLSAPYRYGEFEEPFKGGALALILDRLRDAGYTISFELYNAANFGAPQIRERVVIIGKLHGAKMPYLSPTNSENGEFGLPKWHTFREAVADIEGLPQHHNEFPENRLKYYRMLKEGQYWKNLPPKIQVEAMGDKLKLGGGKTGFLRRIKFDRPAPTLVTDPTMPATDLCHPTEDRPLSIEEYSRVQGFPDDWEICGPINEQYKQIGNAVPIKLGEAIAKTIIADMNKEKLPQYTGFLYSRYKNTSDITWQQFMDKKYEQMRAATKEKTKAKSKIKSKTKSKTKSKNKPNFGQTKLKFD